MRTLLFSAAFLALVACVDTTGLSATIHQDVHPDTAQNALVTVTEYADLQCPACRSAHASLTKPLIEKYGTRIGYDYRHFPLSSIHRFAMEAAEASECAADQGKFWEFVDHDYEHQEDLSSDTLRDWAHTKNSAEPGRYSQRSTAFDWSSATVKFGSSSAIGARPGPRSMRSSFPSTGETALAANVETRCSSARAPGRRTSPRRPYFPALRNGCAYSWSDSVGVNVRFRRAVSAVVVCASRPVT